LSKSLFEDTDYAAASFVTVGTTGWKPFC